MDMSMQKISQLESAHIVKFKKKAQIIKNYFKRR